MRLIRFQSGKRMEYHFLFMNEEFAIYCLYADDLLICLQDPYHSLQETFKTNNIFSQISVYTINLDKSIIPLSEDAWDPTAYNTSLPLRTGNIIYLGINISPNKLSELFNLSYNYMISNAGQTFHYHLFVALLQLKWKLYLRLFVFYASNNTHRKMV